MASLYKAKAGSVMREDTPTAIFLTVDGLDLNGRLVATSLKVDRAADTQYQKTLSSVIYAYAFGEAMGRIQVGGLVFLHDCHSDDSSAAIAQVNSYYSEMNIYQNDSPVIVTVGNAPFKCYLENLSIVVEENQFNFGSFSLSFSTIPKND